MWACLLVCLSSRQDGRSICSPAPGEGPSGLEPWWRGVSAVSRDSAKPGRVPKGESLKCLQPDVAWRAVTRWHVLVEHIADRGWNASLQL